ncbi:MAG: glycosyltransferase family 4 protein [Candidatus Pacebacteria bacterium]|nr:glycosyltransferase family 4 protein [Candidatus Paceibacterota bacterium]
MKFIYLTSKKYPGKTADHNFVKNMAKSFFAKLGSDFLFVVAKDEEKIKEAGVFNLDLKIRRGRSFFYFFWIPFFVFKNRKEKIIFFSNDSNLLLILIFWKKAGRLNYLICSDWHQMFLNWKDKRIARGSDYLITTSERLKKIIMRRTGVSKKNILLARGGVDLDRFIKISRQFSKDEIRKELNLPREKKIIGYIGGFKTMGMGKGIKTMIEALIFLEEKYRMMFVGGKEEEIREYKKFAEEKGVREKCIFVSWQNKEENLIKFEQATDVLVIPYPNEEHFREWGFPMKVYEYMASGRPIIYSNLEIIEEVLGENALKFKPGEESDLVKKIYFLEKNEKKGEEMAEENKKIVCGFTWKRRAENILEFIGVNFK